MIMRTLFSFFVWLYYTVCFLLAFLVVSLVFLITFPFDPYRKAPNAVLKGLAVALLYFNPGWHFHIHGKEKYSSERPTIFVANHQSFFDLPMLYLLPWNMKWVVKESLLYIPLMGWIIWMTGHLSIDRSRKTALKRLDNLVGPLKAHIPVMIFPEGTRTTDGRLRPFKNGAFRLAKKYGFCIQPVVLEGGADALPTHQWRFKPRQNFYISVLDPINPDHFDSLSGLRDMAFSNIQQELHRLQALDAQ